MAERRMFAKTIIDSDSFLDMSLSTQALYFHLSMRADDDGFINNPKKIQRMIGATNDDLKLLIAKNFIIPFESGVVVIKHWKIHNYIQSDRYKETVYTDEKAMLTVKENKAYTLGIPNGNQLDTECIQNGYSLETQVRLGKESIGKDSKESIPAKPKRTRRGEYNHVLLTDEEYQKLQKEYGNADELIRYLDEYKEMKGYKCKNDYLAIRKWVVDAVREKSEPRRVQASRQVVPLPSYFRSSTELKNTDHIDLSDFPEDD